MYAPDFNSVGMPVDILQLLQEVEVNDKEFDIKRLNGSGNDLVPEHTDPCGTPDITDMVSLLLVKQPVYD
jgi:hypothetical protein